jgi:Ca2+-binding RTX toxin-like protein
MLRKFLPIALLAGLLVAAPAAGKASHKGWPKIDGQLWINKYDVPATHYGTPKNDELLSGHSSDTVYGEGGRDVIWGDYKAQGNNSWQHDVLSGGARRDFIYASHGHNVIDAGSGNDVVHAHFGRGRVDCGSGNDLLYLSHRSKPGYKISNCERITFRHGENA